MNTKLDNLLMSFDINPSTKEDIYTLISMSLEALRNIMNGDASYKGLPVRIDMRAWGEDAGDRVLVCLGGAALLEATDLIFDDCDWGELHKRMDGLYFLNSLRTRSNWDWLECLGFNLPNQEFNYLKCPELLINLLDGFLENNKSMEVIV